MTDLRTLIDREAERARVSPDALDRTRSLVRRRQRRRRVAGGVVGIACLVPAVVLVWLALSGGPRPNVAPGGSSPLRPPPQACPAYGFQVQLRSTEDGAGKALVPGRPISARLCQYNGVNGSAPSKLITMQDVSDRIIPFTSILNQLAPVPNGDVYYCPFDDGTDAVLYLQYADDGQVTIRINLKGCQFVSNGLIRAATSYESRSRLEQLLGIRFGPS